MRFAILLCNLVVLLHVRSNHLHIDGRRQSEIQNLRDDVRGLEEEFGARETAAAKLHASVA